MGSKPLNTSLREAASCSEVSSCAGLLPPKGLPEPGLLTCFTMWKRDEETGKLWTPGSCCSSPVVVAVEPPGVPGEGEGLGRGRL